MAVNICHNVEFTIALTCCNNIVNRFVLWWISYRNNVAAAALSNSSDLRKFYVELSLEGASHILFFVHFNLPTFRPEHILMGMLLLSDRILAHIGYFIWCQKETFVCGNQIALQHNYLFLLREMYSSFSTNSKCHRIFNMVI